MNVLGTSICELNLESKQKKIVPHRGSFFVLRSLTLCNLDVQFRNEQVYVMDKDANHDYSRDNPHNKPIQRNYKKPMSTKTIVEPNNNAPN